MILAGDVGGTKTLLGLFEFAPRRPVAVEVRTLPTTRFAGLPAMIEEFYATLPSRPRIDAAAFGVAGPVINQAATMTNVDWSVDATELSRVFDFPRVRLLNDLEAMAYGVPVLEGDELHTLQPGHAIAEGNVALVAAGTGLGTALLHRTGGHYVPIASEGGHSDFAARTDREMEFVRFLRARYGRAEIEYVLSGPGLVNLAIFTHNGSPCPQLAAAGEPLPAAAVSSSALSGNCDRCAEALTMFVSAYGAVAGNLALIGVTTGGVFIGGGIAPRILPAMTMPTFVEAFNAKEPMRPLLEVMPVQVIMNPQSALLGAAVYAAAMI